MGYTSNYSLVDTFICKNKPLNADGLSCFSRRLLSLLIGKRKFYNNTDEFMSASLLLEDNKQISVISNEAIKTEPQKKVGRER